MEISVIEQWLEVDYGNGYGRGNGNGYDYGDSYGYGRGNSYSRDNGNGDGYGQGNSNGYGYDKGCGHGRGSGNGDGYGNGYGNGNGYGIKSIEGESVYKVDGVPTIITSIHGNYAKGYILRDNVIKVPCYIAKCGNYFAHGKTLKEARADARVKYDENRPLEERIADFMKQYPTLNSIAKHSDLYKWHNILTGSCEFGRQEWAKAHNLSWETGKMTICKFIKLTRTAYGGDVIQQLYSTYKACKME